MTTIDDIQQQLFQIRTTIVGLTSPITYQNMINNYLLQNTTSLGTEANQVIGGFLSLTQGGLPIAQLTADVPGFQNQLTTPVGSASNDLSLITGTSAEEGALDVVVSLGTPTAISYSLSNTVNTTPNKLNNVVSTIQGPTNSLTQESVELFSGAGELLSTSVEQAMGPIFAGITDITETLNSVISGPINDINAAISSVIPTSGPLISVSLTTPNISSMPLGITPTPVGAQPSAPYNYVKTEEEIEFDLRSTTREITELVVHNTGAAVDANALASYYEKMPYHFIILTNGSIQRGISLDKLGGELNNNHQKYSIQLAFSGSSSLTVEQTKAFQSFLNKAFLVWPGLQVLGHSDIDRSQSDPGFSVPEFVKNYNGKTNVFTDPSSQPSFSRSALINFKV